MVMHYVCITLGSWALGMWSAFFLYGWFEERSDRYDRIIWSRELGTAVNYKGRRFDR